MKIYEKLGHFFETAFYVVMVVAYATLFVFVTTFTVTAYAPDHEVMVKLEAGVNEYEELQLYDPF